MTTLYLYFFQTIKPPGQQVQILAMEQNQRNQSTSTPEKKRLIMQQLIFLLHAHTCEKRAREAIENGHFIAEVNMILVGQMSSASMLYFSSVTFHTAKP